MHTAKINVDRSRWAFEMLY